MKGVNTYNQISTQTDVNEASPHRLIQMLINAALQKLIAAKGYIANGKIAEKGRQIGLVVSILDGLKASLDREKGGDIAANLDNLYSYMSIRLTEANYHNDVSVIDEIIALLRPIKEAWDAIPPEVQQGYQQLHAAGTPDGEKVVTG